jgi:hypothetical protein
MLTQDITARTTRLKTYDMHVTPRVAKNTWPSVLSPQQKSSLEMSMAHVWDYTEKTYQYPNLVDRNGRQKILEE